MAKFYISSLVTKAAVIIATIALFFATVSGQDGDENNNQFCGCDVATDQKGFSAHVSKVLDDVVARTTSVQQPKNPDSGDTVFTTTSNPGASLDRGAAVATGTCFKGSTVNCTGCLAKLRKVLKSCETFECGGGEFPGDCHLQFGTIK